ncbi:inositol-3-phosphate synthase [Candidatus Micrarchaeota archaeon]|nr:inositol-3-phosphate synthase [Candidatus Micrarchaeota archaeon]
MEKKIKIGIIGVGNCASGFIQGIEYYKQHPEREVVGIMHQDIGGYDVRDIEVACAFDVDKNKVGKTLDEAIYIKPNMVDWLRVPKSNVVVKQGPLYDGLGKYLEGIVEPVGERPIEELKKEIVAEIKKTGAGILINYLPVGSQKATEFWAEIALETKWAFINAIPVFIASTKEWAERFEKANVPVIGDDMKGMVGATIVHRVLAKLTADRGSELTNTYQLNVGGNTDFKNMLERERLESKKISKTESVQSQLKKPLAPENIHIGPSDYVQFLGNTKIAFMRLRGKMWADIPYDLEVKLEVDDKANAGGVIADAVRIAKVALDRKIGGALIGPSAYLMKHPPVQMADNVAKMDLEKFFE